LAAYFDHIAHRYDELVAASPIGDAQRRLIWGYLDKWIQNSDSLDILEVNCGTGIDAFRFAAKGHKVEATDISEAMIRECEKKKIGNPGSVNFAVCSFEEIGDRFGGRQFDLLFSNFGGLNCLAPEKWPGFSASVARLVKPRGRFIAVIMPGFCAWEFLYFSIKGNWGAASRRLRGRGSAHLWGKQFPVYYFSPKSLVTYFRRDFQIKNRVPIGLFVPPSYLEDWFIKHPKQLSRLVSLESKICPGFFSGMADNFMIELVRK
jgi:SAM-dependent methyltransferase